ncbi:MAG: competence protein [Mesorhizobium sp.]|uniref:competence protein CoiA n=3 Tax=Mesorhizobium sp. TaxID=1871066 RepID=UPI000FCC8D33|nr:competence protein [Mesorhizobium sp. M5C.F.Cr.IN.023.01.1.1]RWJ06594.1 MAG: competence protein [Mesorhizobium sp.]RWJ10172.1 MAG: competence protein [Mesorhizobium sp.]RWJ61299.1 MAG: competence protein [Mesorhizobium sp.]RWL04074.1 MAG: competence protein [Mesorhizobium sp.]
MRYALINGERHEAEPRLVGTCPGCAQAMVAKCGDQRIHHWAHKGMRVCDPWWEPETPWHRAWKREFEDAWQEVILHDELAEKHIADVRTDHGLVLEFQHSHISPLERSREAFYRNMAWIVDGTRRKRDLPRFIDGHRSLRPSPWRGIYTTPFPQECFPSDWLDRAVPVFFDFAGMEPLDQRAGIERCLLWGLLPGRADGHARHRRSCPPTSRCGGAHPAPDRSGPRDRRHPWLPVSSGARRGASICGAPGLAPADTAASCHSVLARAFGGGKQE